jgi:hypothetical protein
MEIASRLEVDLMYLQLLRKIKEAVGQNSVSWGCNLRANPPDHTLGIKIHYHFVKII